MKSPKGAIQFTKKLDEPTEKQVKQCDQLLTDPARLAALKRTGIMGSENEQAFDRLAHLAAKILKVPLTIISFLDDEKQFFKAGFGLPAPYDTLRQIPIDSSICRYTLQGQPIIAEDASVDPLLMSHPTTKPWGIVAFIALPMITHEGHVLGAFCAVDTKKRPWSDEDIFLMQELTASVMTEIHLRVQIKELEHEQGFRERFVATLSHDLRTPISVAKMAAELLQSEDCDLEERKKMTQMIWENMDRADRMILDLLDASQIKAGQVIHLTFEKCDLQAITQSVIASLSSIHGNRFILKSPAEYWGYWDNLAIRRMIENLALNAIKYGSSTAPVTLTIHPEPDAHSDTTNEAVKISVHNVGDPIETKNLELLFEAYRRSDSAANGSKRGWGIGLTLVRGIASALGGSVTVESSLSQGTTFSIILPRDSRTAQT